MLLRGEGTHIAQTIATYCATKTESWQLAHRISEAESGKAKTGQFSNLDSKRSRTAERSILGKKLRLQSSAGPTTRQTVYAISELR